MDKQKLGWVIALSFSGAMVLLALAPFAAYVAPLLGIGVGLLGLSFLFGSFGLLRVYTGNLPGTTNYLSTVRKEWKAAPVAVAIVAAGIYIGSPVFVFSGMGIYFLAFLRNYLD